MEQSSFVHKLLCCCPCSSSSPRSERSNCPDKQDTDNNGAATAANDPQEEDYKLATVEHSLLLCIPDSLLVTITTYLDRLDLNRSACTCRGIYKIVNNPALVTKSWPPNFQPWRGTGRAPGEIMLSQPDGAHAAIYYAGNPREEIVPTWQMWDRSEGLVATHETRGLNAFSPNGQHFAFTTAEADGNDEDNLDVIVFDFQRKTYQRIVSREHVDFLDNQRTLIFHIAFLDNERLLVLSHRGNFLFTIDLTSGGVSRLLDQQPHHEGCYLVAAHSDEDKEWVAYLILPDVNDDYDHYIIFYDLRNKKWVCRSIGPHWGCRIAFSPNGEFLLVTGITESVMFFGLRNAKTVDDIGHVIDLTIQREEGVVSPLRGTRASFLPNGLVVMMTYNGGILVCEIDLEECKVLARQFSSWKQLVGTDFAVDEREQRGLSRS